tara:strand:+ start:814 stop:969 length:156 start_codon:yes stop_codon:yes gene_type:complete
MVTMDVSMWDSIIQGKGGEQDMRVGVIVACHVVGNFVGMGIKNTMLVGVLG